MKPFTSLLTQKKARTPLFTEYIFTLSEGELTFTPGQFVSLMLTDPQTPRPVTRAYSIAHAYDGVHTGSTVTTKSYSLFVETIPGGKGTSILAQLPLNSAIKTIGPSGHLVSPEPVVSDAHLYFLAASTGVTPFLALLQHLQACRQFYNITLLWGLKTMSDVCYLEELNAFSDAWKQAGASLSYHICISRDEAQNVPQTPPYIHGRMTPMLMQSFTDPSSIYMVCGGKTFVTETKQLIQEQAPHACCLTERFN